VLARAKKRPEGAESLRFVRSCSSALSSELLDRLERLLEVPVIEAYGMTEAAHQMASNLIPPHVRRPGSVGPPSGAVKISIIDEGGKHLWPGAFGEIVIQGPNVFSGYENSPEVNAKAFVNGWFRTGDRGYIDENGYLHLTARLKELINRAGEKIAPKTIDEVLLRHPAVAEAVAFGFPHPVWGEEVGAAVVLREPETEAALLKYCREHLAEFECPKKLYIVESIPKTATGKIQRGNVAGTLTKRDAAA
jgi:acyl-CoA synthetase (AMP-forming)/AMP-acid ligase II